MASVKSSFPLLLAVLVTGCGATQRAVPPRPLESGEIETRIAAGFSTSKFAMPNVQVSGWVGVGDRDAIGWCLADVFVPASISYAHYWERDDDFGSFQVHVGNIFGLTYDPLIEIDVAASAGGSDHAHTLKLGMGFYGTSWGGQLAGRRRPERALLPIVGYQWQGHHAMGEVDLAYGVSKHLVRFYNEPTAPESETPGVQRVYAPRDIARVTPGDGDDRLPIHVDLTDGRRIVIADRDPLADCIGCELTEHNRSAYTASAGHRVVWVWFESPQDRSWSDLALVQLDLARILSHYNAGGALDLREEPDAVPRSVGRARNGLHDLSFSLGWWTRSGGENPPDLPR